jgi:hypothetical protein
LILLPRCLARWARLLSTLLLIAAAAAPAAEPGRDREHHGAADPAAAGSRALQWIENHPATPEDGGLPDMIDEGLAFRAFQRLAATPADRERFAGLFRSRMVAIDGLPEFQRWVARPHKALIEHYHLVLAAHLMRVAGHQSPSIPRIRQQAQQALAGPARDNPTVRLTTAVFLSRLGGSGDTQVDRLLELSLIEQLARNPGSMALPSGQATEQERRSATWLLYALVHEVVALTDFGQLPPSPWLRARTEAVSRFIRDAVPWAAAENNMDLVAELVVTLRFLDQPLSPELERALDRLLSEQRPDGSWGPSATTTRPNRVRHTVLTGAAALLAYRAWREQEQARETPLPSHRPIPEPE